VIGEDYTLQWDHELPLSEQPREDTALPGDELPLLSWKAMPIMAVTFRGASASERVCRRDNVGLG
jgi:hypothetical protein